MGFAYSRIMNESFTMFKFRVETKYTAMPIIVGNTITFQKIQQKFNSTNLT